MATADSTTERTCNVCGNIYPLTSEYWHKDKKAKHGLAYRCKSCAKAVMHQWEVTHRERVNGRSLEYARKNPEKVRETKRKSALKHRDKKNAKSREFKAANRDRMRAASKDYYRRNKDKVAAKEKRRRQANPDYERERQRKWREANPDKVQATVQRRRAKRKQLPVAFTAHDWQNALHYFNHACAYCGQKPNFWTLLAMDHFIPLDRGGATVAGNIVPACHEKPGVPSGDPCCNTSKGSKDPQEWLEKTFGRRKSREILDRIRKYFDSLS